MVKEKLGRVLLVDGNVPITRFLELNLRNSGFDVVVMNDINKALASAPQIMADVVALASHFVEESGEAITRLRKVLPCPVLVYGVGRYTEEEKRQFGADHWVDRFYEPDEFLKAVKATLARKPPRRD